MSNPEGVEQEDAEQSTRGDELWAWQAQDSDGSWNIVSALLDDQYMPLVFNGGPTLLELVQPLVIAHAEGKPIRLMHFVAAEQVR